jgi:trimeric autotransporter adhesin
MVEKVTTLFMAGKVMMLDGEIGVDDLNGELGNDTYVVDNTLDVVTELLNEGTDTVQSRVTDTLRANVENLILIGGGTINGTGNALNNILIGNSAANTLTGGAGNDTYVIDSTLDTVVEALNQGTDTVQASITYTLGSNVEKLTLTGTAHQRHGQHPRQYLNRQQRRQQP